MCKVLTCRWAESKVVLAGWYVIHKDIWTGKHLRRNSKAIKVYKLASSQEEIYTADKGKPRLINIDTSLIFVAKRTPTTWDWSEIRASLPCSCPRSTARVLSAVVKTCNNWMTWATEVYCTIKWANSPINWTIKGARRVYMVDPSETTCQFTRQITFRTKVAPTKNRSTTTLAADIKALTNKMILPRYTWFQTIKVQVPYQINLDKIKAWCRH